jgi:large subunit ribosomal protein L10
MGARPQKEQKVQELTERFRSASGAMFADFRGLTVKDAMELRRALRAADTTLTVAKNTLTSIAARQAGLDGVVALLVGPTAIAFIDGDPVAGARALMESARRFPAMVVKGAVVEGRVLGADDAQALATMDAREVSIAKVAGLLQSPISRIAYLLRAPLQRMAYALAERGRQAGEGAEPAPAEPAPIEPEPIEPAESEPAPAADTAEAPAAEAPVVEAAETSEAETSEAEAPEADTSEAASEAEAAEAEAPQAEAAGEPEAGTETTESTE